MVSSHLQSAGSGAPSKLPTPAGDVEPPALIAECIMPSVQIPIEPEQEALCAQQQYSSP